MCHQGQEALRCFVSAFKENIMAHHATRCRRHATVDRGISRGVTTIGKPCLGPIDVNRESF